MTGYTNNDTFIHSVIRSYGTVCFDESACFSDPNPERRHISDWTAAVYFVAATLSSVGQRLMFE